MEIVMPYKQPNKPKKLAMITFFIEPIHIPVEATTEEELEQKIEKVKRDVQSDLDALQGLLVSIDHIDVDSSPEVATSPFLWS
jgi:hypothetical protein